MQIDPTSDAYIFSCIHKVYNEKFRRYVYYYWVAKHVKAPTVEKKVASCSFQHGQQHCNLRFVLTTCTSTTYEGLIWEDFANFFNLISNARGEK